VTITDKCTNQKDDKYKYGISGNIFITTKYVADGFTDCLMHIYFVMSVAKLQLLVSKYSMFYSTK